MDNYISTPGTFVPSTGSRFELTPQRKTALLVAGGAAAGAAQTILLKKYLDATPPAFFTTFSFLGGFGKPSALIGILGGAAGLIAGLFLIRDQRIQNVLVGYGGSALATGILSGAGLILIDVSKSPIPLSGSIIADIRPVARP